MFGKKKNFASAASESGVNITAIPDVFYGGKDPAVYPSNGRAKASAGARGPGGFLPWKKIVFISAPFFVAAVGGISWYYIRQARPAPVQREVTNQTATGETAPLPSVEVPTTDAVVSDQLPVVTTTAAVTAPPLPSLAATPSVQAESTLSFPAIFLSDSPDADVDGLTDAEEEIFGTDSGVWDTDSDGYYDGQELLNLYNPKGTSPVKLVDSGFVKEYVNPRSGYRLYYPSAWEVGTVEDDARVLFNSITGDFIEARVFHMDAAQPFSDWFAATAPGEIFANLIPVTNRFQTEGYRRKDDLAAYFPGDKSVIVIVYHPTANSEAIPFRHVVALMTASFRFGSAVPSLPEQAVLPNAPQ